MGDVAPSTWSEVEKLNRNSSPSAVPAVVADIQEFLAQNCLCEQSAQRTRVEPREVLRDDLLGLGKINVETGAFIRSNWSSQRSPVTKLDPEESLRFNPASEKFNPEAYLAHFHCNTSYEELKNGKQVLEAVMRRHSKDLQIIVKENFHRLVPCETAVRDVREMVLGRQGGEAKGAAKELEKSFNETEELTQRLYGPLLERRVQTERMRRVLKLVEQYPYVFDLPRRLREVIGKEDIRSIADDYAKAKLWLSAQKNPKLVQKVSAAINSAMDDFRSRQYLRLEDPSTGKEQLEEVVRILEALQPGVNHALKVITVRKDKALEKLMKIRGLGAADVVLRQRLTPQADSKLDIASSKVEKVKDAVENAGTIVHLLSCALYDGLSHFWQLAVVMVNGKEDPRAEPVQMMLTELLTEYAEGVRMTLLPRTFSGAALISHESALEVRQAFNFAVELGIEIDRLGPLVAICSEVAESYAASVVRCMRNVAVELGSDYPRDFHTLAEQVRLLVSEALTEMEAVVLRGTEAAFLAKNACVRTPVAAAKALRALALAREKRTNGEELDHDIASKYLLMASCCHQLRTVSLLEIKNAVSAAFGEEGLEALIGSASAAIEKTELFLIDLFAHEAAIPLVMRVSRGFVAGGAVLSLLPRPRAYAMELVLELSMCFATVRSAGLSLRAQIVCSPLVQAVGNAFREGIRDFGDLNGVAADQCLFEIEFVEQTLRNIQDVHDDHEDDQVATERTSAFAAAKSILHSVRGGSDFSRQLHQAIESVAFLHL